MSRIGVAGGLVWAAFVGVVVWHNVSQPDLSQQGLDTVFMGDSITQADSEDFEGVPGRGSWVRYVVTDDRTPWRFEANVAVGGDTLADMATRFERDVLAREPQAVVIMGGTNDALRLVPLADSIASLRDMIGVAQEAGVEVWLVSPPPLIATPESQDALARLVRAQSGLSTDGGVKFVKPPADVPTHDGVHPTDDGAATIANSVLDHVGGGE